MSTKEKIKTALENYADTSGDAQLRAAIGTPGYRIEVENETQDTGQAYVVPSVMDGLLTAIGEVAGEVLVTSSDDDTGTLNEKLLVTTGMTKTTLSPGGNEKLQLSLAFGTTTGTVCAGNDSRFGGVQVTTEDTTPSTLDEKVLVTTGMEKEVLTPGGDEKLQLSLVFGSAAGTICAGNDPRLAGGNFGVVRVVSTDTTPAELNSKVEVTGGVLKTVVTPTGDAKLQLALQYGTAAGTVCEGNDPRLQDVSSGATVKITTADTAASVLNDKLVVATGLSKTTLNPGANEQMQLAPVFGSDPGELCSGDNYRLYNDRFPLEHNFTHQHLGTDEVSTVTPTANAIPKADPYAKLDEWVSDATATVKGKLRLTNDLSGTALEPTVVGLSNDPLPTHIGSGFLKRNVSNNAWEEVGYASGEQANTVCAGNDPRLDDDRWPLHHKDTHKHLGDDEVSTATPAANAIAKADGSGKLDAWISDAGASVKGLTTYGTGGTNACVGNDGRLSDDRWPLHHASSHLPGGDDLVATGTPGPSVIPVADTFGHLDSWVSFASDTVPGIVQLTNDLGGTATAPTVVGLNDDPLPSNSVNGFLKRNAANNAWEEVAYGSSANTVLVGNTKLDDLATPDDNTDLNASVSRHGLLPKLDGITTHFLDGSGAWATPAGGGGGGGGGASVYVTAAQPATTIDSGAGYVQFFPASGSSSLVVPIAGTYDVEFCGIFWGRRGAGGARVKFVVDEGLSGELTIGGDTDNHWAVRVDSSIVGDHTLLSSVVLTAKTYTLKGYFKTYDTNGTSVVGTAVCPVHDQRIGFNLTAGDTDVNAIHKNAAAEISTLAEVTPVSADLLIIEDFSDSYNKKKVQIGNLPGGSGTDVNAIHKNVAAEISTITEKVTPVSADLLIIEDSADSNSKKRVQIGNLPSGGGGGGTTIEQEYTATGGNQSFTLATNPTANISMISGYNILSVRRNGAALRYQASPTTGLEWGFTAPNQVVCKSLTAGDFITVLYGNPSLAYQVAPVNIQDLLSSVPFMTSDTAPSGVCSASSTYGTAPAWHAFAAAQNGWITNGGGAPGWIQYQFTSAKTILSYSIVGWSVDTYPGRLITAWTLQGSNNGTNFTVLDTRTKLWRTGWVPWQPQLFLVTTPGSYSYYRLNITANYGGDAYVGVQHLALYEF